MAKENGNAKPKRKRKRSKRKKQLEPKSKLYLNSIVLLSIFLMVMGMVSMSVLMLKHENGGGSVLWSYLGILSFFVFTFATLVVFCYNASYFMIEAERKLTLKYQNHPVQCIAGCGQGQVQAYLQQNGFEKGRTGAYDKVCWIAWRNRKVDTAVQWVTLADDEDLEEAILRESAFYIRKKQRTNYTVCLLFVGKSGFTEAELAHLKDRAVRQILMDNMHIGPVMLSIVPVLVDTTQNKGYYIHTQSPRDGSMYAYACKLLQKISKGAQEKA